MIKILTETDKQAILDFCYKREKENLFVIGSFEFGYDAFAFNRYIGCFEDEKMVGLGTFFGYNQHKSLNINVDDLSLIPIMVEAFADKIPDIGFVTGFRKYSESVYRYVLSKYDKKPAKVFEEAVYELSRQNFKPAHETITLATEDDIEEITRLHRIEGDKDLDAPITKADRERYNLVPKCILRKDGRIVSTSNIHGCSKQYFQIGGVLTPKEHRGNGYATQAVSSLCQYYFDKGHNKALLFVENDNTSAQRVYHKLGFKPTDKFMIIEY